MEVGSASHDLADYVIGCNVRAYQHSDAIPTWFTNRVYLRRYRDGVRTTFTTRDPTFAVASEYRDFSHKFDRLVLSNFPTRGEEHSSSVSSNKYPKWPKLDFQMFIQMFKILFAIAPLGERRVTREV